MFYELFLDEHGQKISKSKGNGLSIDEWLHYAPQETLALFMYASPQRAKKLHYSIIPKYVDEYIAHLNSFIVEQDLAKQMANPIYHLCEQNNSFCTQLDVNYSLILNLISACNADNVDVIWKYLATFNLSRGQHKFLDDMLCGAMNYYKEFVQPHRQFREASAAEKEALLDLSATIQNMQDAISAAALQQQVYAIGKKHEFDLKEWFRALYEILLGASQGPRFGSFIAIYGVAETVKLIEEKLAVSQ
jgi:lysyl-tRNA synthetase class 1